MVTPLPSGLTPPEALQGAPFGSEHEAPWRRCVPWPYRLCPAEPALPWSLVLALNVNPIQRQGTCYLATTTSYGRCVRRAFLCGFACARRRQTVHGQSCLAPRAARSGFFDNPMYKVVGPVDAMRLQAKETGRRWIRGSEACAAVQRPSAIALTTFPQRADSHFGFPRIVRAWISSFRRVVRSQLTGSR